MVTRGSRVSAASPQVPGAVLASLPAQGLPCGAGDHGTTTQPAAGPCLCPKTGLTKSIMFIFCSVLFTLATSLLSAVLIGW